MAQHDRQRPDRARQLTTTKGVRPIAQVYQWVSSFLTILRQDGKGHVASDIELTLKIELMTKAANNGT